MKKKALMELAESGDTEAVARHYNISKQTVYNWESGLKRKNKKFESRQIQDSLHFQELLKLKEIQKYPLCKAFMGEACISTLTNSPLPSRTLKSIRELFPPRLGGNKGVQNKHFLYG